MIPAGLLIIDKEDGPTSHDVVARIRRWFGIRRIGHTGTLDPFATGVLVVLVGRATQISRFLVESEKEYLAEAQWGTATNTMDRTGEPVERADRPRPSEEEIRRAAAAFLGEIEQIPPMFSAKKIGGKTLHHMARKGIEVDRKPARVRIDRFDLLGVDENGFTISVVCTQGTYIRSLIDELGRALGGFAHIRQLRRLASGRFRAEQAVKLNDIIRLSPEDPGERMEFLQSRLIGMNDALSDYPQIVVEGEQIRLIANGNRLRLEGIDRPAGTVGFVRVVDPAGGLLAMARIDEKSGCLKPVRVWTSGGGSEASAD